MVERLVVELAGLVVQGGSLLDGAEAGDAKGLTGLGDGLGPAADVLERALAVGVLLLGDDLSRLVFRERCLRETTLALGSLSAPDAAAGNTRADGLLLGLPALLRGLPTRN